MPEKQNNDETVSSEKLSSKDVEEIQRGLCNTCALLTFAISLLALIATIL